MVQGRNLMTMPISEASREEIVDSIKRFLSPVNKFKVSTVALATLMRCWILVLGMKHESEVKAESQFTNKQKLSVEVLLTFSVSFTQLLTKGFNTVNICN